MRVVKPDRDKAMWALNSSAVLFCSFLSIGLLQDLLIWLAAKAIGIPLIYKFDYIYLKPGVLWSDFNHIEILLLFAAMPFGLIIIGLANLILFGVFKQRKDLRKLFFLWSVFVTFAILGGSTITSFVDRGTMQVLWDFLYLNIEFLPFMGFVVAAFLLVFGSISLRFFLNMAPSSTINKKRETRLAFYLYVVIIPAAFFSLSGLLWYPRSEIISRFFSAQMIWVPVISGFVSSFQNSTRLKKTSAFKESGIRNPQYVYYFLATALMIMIYIFA